ncbi:MAG TPA: amino acid racemase [Geminicoccaceae bacterium]|nr:amino acid racemase [Geminicoccaceae bacterium]
MIGILGGMGPAATVDFIGKLIRLTPAGREQDHLPLVVVSDPRVPDRVGPIVDGAGPSPLPAMSAGIRRLERAGAECVAVPCHTAHAWYDQLAAATALPILHIVDAALAELERLAVPKGPLGLVATAATLKAGLYQARLAAAGHPVFLPPPAVMAECVLPAIALVKQDRAAAAAPLVLRAVDHLTSAGATRVLLACTELPIALAATPHPACIDATEALARSCLAWWQAREP